MAKRKVLGAGVVAVALLLTACGSSESPDPPSSPSSSAVVSSEATRTIVPRYVTDFSDVRKLAGYADSIFVGKVERYVSTRNRGGVPETEFEISVVRGLKGGIAQGRAVVVQEGGDGGEGKSSVIVAGDHPLAIGAGYAFFGRMDGKLVRIVPKYGNQELLSEDVSELESGRFTPAIQAIADAIDGAIPYP